MIIGVTSSTVYQDPDGNVLWRDGRGGERKTGYMITGPDSRLYLVLRVVKLTSDQTDAYRITVENID